MSIFLLCSLLALFVTSVENFPLIFRMLRRAMATVDRFFVPVADGVPWPASAHEKIKHITEHLNTVLGLSNSTIYLAVQIKVQKIYSTSVWVTSINDKKKLLANHV